MACLRLVGHKLYIQLRLQLDPMACPSRNAQFHYIQLRLQLHPMACPSRGAQIHYIHLRSQPYPMEHLPRNVQIHYIHLRTRPNPMERPHLSGQIRWSTRNLQQKNFRPQVPRDRKQDFLPSVTNQFTISDQFRNFPKLLSSRLVP